MSNKTLSTLLLAILGTGLMVGSGVLLLFPRDASGENETEEKLDFTEEAVRQFHILMEDVKTWTPAQQKLQAGIVYKLKKDRGDPIFDHLPEFRTDLDIEEDGTIWVTIHGDITEDLRDKVVALGGSFRTFRPGTTQMVCRVPLDRIETLAESPEIRHIWMYHPPRFGPFIPNRSPRRE